MLEVSLDSLRWARARGGLLVGEGGEDAVAVARRLFGAQAQVESCAVASLSLRTAGRPSAEAITRLMDEDRALVRTWGQRGTLHLYDAEDLALVNGARATWSTCGRRDAMPDEALLDTIARRFLDAEAPLTRSELLDHMPDAFVASVEGHPGSGGDARRFATTRVIWALSRRGDVVHARAEGREQGYAHRERWCPHLSWRVWERDAANAEAARRYLATFGPATWRDVAYHLGASTRDVKRWCARLDDEITPVRCDGRELVALSSTLATLDEAPGDWPIRLLPAYDTALMGHHDKRVILPDAAEEPLVWRKAAVLAPVILSRGQIVATWSHKRRTRAIDVEVSPLGAWDPASLPEVTAEAEAFAAHLGLELGELRVV